MGKGLLPPGFRFHATDVELIMYYLKRKVMGKRIPYEIISERKIYEFSPQDLPGESSLKSRDLEWYFFCRREMKYENGGRMNRKTNCGFWKTTGKDRTVLHENQIVGHIRTLIFHEGRAPQGNRTDWVMYEYRLEDKVLATIGIDKDEFVLCKLFQKSGLGPQNGAQYGAPFIEEDWNSEDESDLVKSILFPSMAAPATVLNNIPGLQPCDNFQSVVDTFGGHVTIISNANDENEVDKPSNAQNANGGTLSVEEDNIFSDLGDLTYQVNIYSAGDAQDRLHPGDAFMELGDLDYPLEAPSNGNGSNFVPPSSGSSGNFVPATGVSMACNYFHNLEHLGCPSDVCGVANHAAASICYPPMLAGRSYGSENQMDVFQKDNEDLAVSYLELNDLDKPLEVPVDASDVCMDYSCWHDHDHIVQPSNNFGLMGNAAASCHYPPAQADKSNGSEDQIDVPTKKSVGENAKQGYLGLEPASYSTEGLKLGSGHMVQTHKRGREQTESYWRLQQLLESIPSRPASAALHHPGESNRQGKITCNFCTSVGVAGRCFDEDEEAPSDKLELACMGYCGCNPNLRRRKRDLRKEAAVWDGNMMFVLLLGMLSTSMWMFIATIVMKLGRLAWDLLS